MNCNGPCLQHCYYKDNNLLIFFIGFVVGIVIKMIYDRCNNKKINNNKNK